MVLDKGVVVQSGKHTELVENSEIYRDLYNLDLEVSRGLN